MSSDSKDVVRDSNKAEYLNQAKDYQKAVVYCSRAAQKDKTENPGIYEKWGTALQEQFKYKEAIAKYSRSIQICSEYIDVYSKWGFCLLYMGKFDEAYVKFEEAAKMIPVMKFYKVNCSLVLFVQGKVLEAKEILMNEKDRATIYVCRYRYFYRNEIRKQRVRLEMAKDKEEKELIKSIIKGIIWIMENTKTWKTFY